MARHIPNSTALKQYGYTVCSPESLYSTVFRTELKPNILLSQLRSEKEGCSEILGMYLKTSEPNQDHKISQLKYCLGYLFQIPEIFLMTQKM